MGATAKAPAGAAVLTNPRRETDPHCLVIIVLLR
jgi:hypothetical protein